MTTTDFLLVLATALSPLIAVRVSRYLEIKKESRDKKMHIFRVLMATRAYNLSFGHVEALNSIEVEFSTKNKSEKAVIDSWQAYLDHLGSTSIDGHPWVMKRVELLCDLLHSMAICLGYDFSKTQLKNGVYSPNAHGKFEQETDKVRALTIEFLEGKRMVPVGVMPISGLGQTQSPSSPGEDGSSPGADSPKG